MLAVISRAAHQDSFDVQHLRSSQQLGGLGLHLITGSDVKRVGDGGDVVFHHLGQQVITLYNTQYPVLLQGTEAPSTICWSTLVL